MRVAFVTHQPYLVLFANGQDAFELAAVHNTAGGIAGRIDNHHFGFRGDCFLDVRGLCSETVFGAHLHDHGGAAGIFDDVGIADPVGGGDDHLIAVLNQDTNCVEDRMLAANVHPALFGRVVRTEFATVPHGDGFAQRHDACRWRVFCAILFNRLDSGALDVVWRREVGIAGT